MYNSLPEDKPSGSKRVEDIKKNKNQNINLGNVYFFGLYFIIILQCTVQKRTITTAITDKGEVG